jgi:dTDP-4-amino-4,6-dideoxygalactose transaminase
MIRMVDLGAQNADIQDRVTAELAQLHRNTAYVGGPQASAFEADFAAFCGVKRAVGVASGTDALRLALLAAGVGPECEVITAPMTFIATAAAIVQTGARPVLVDIDPVRRTLDPAALREYLQAGKWATRKGPRAIVPVHLYGMPAAMDEILALARAWDLAVIEDACQAHGAHLDSGGRIRRAGSLGQAGCFSFYPGKNLGGWGEGGAITTADLEMAERVERLRDHGRLSHYAHAEYGYNARLDTLQAVVLHAKLTRLEEWNARRRRVAAWYRELLADSGLQLPAEVPGTQSCYHLFVIQSPRRDAIRQALLRAQIQCGVHYPLPLHLQPACRALNYQRGTFPHSEHLADTALSLPMHPHLTASDCELVAKTVAQALRTESAHV